MTARQLVTIAVSALWLAACSQGTTPAPGGDGGLPDSGLADGGGGLPDAGPGDAGCEPDAGTLVIDCSPDGGLCPEIDVGEDAGSTASFNGFADPSITSDPATPGRMWLAYSFLDGRLVTGPSGQAGVATVETHLAESDDQGLTWSDAGVLWPVEAAQDPDSGVNGLLNSEVPSILGVNQGGQITWYGSHLRYFQQPISGYHPEYTTSWVIRVGSAQGATPAVLATAPEAVLGVATTSAGWNVDVRLDSLSPDLADCALWNNPDLAYQNGELILATECIAFDQTGAVDDSRSKVVVFATTPSGAPTSWQWHYAGTLSDPTLSAELGTPRLDEPELTHAQDGTLLALLSPRAGGSRTGVGCLALAMESFDPPVLRRDCAGNLVLRADQTSFADSNFHTAACSYDPASLGGILTVDAWTPTGVLKAAIAQTGLRP